MSPATRPHFKAWRRLDTLRRATRWLRTWKPRWLHPGTVHRPRPRIHGAIARRHQLRTEATRMRMAATRDRELVQVLVSTMSEALALIRNSAQLRDTKGP